jgi:hypothetical protein
MTRLWFVAALLAACSGSKTTTATAQKDAGMAIVTSGGGDAGVLPKIDRTAEVKALFVAWNAPNAVVTIHEAAHPRFQESVKQSELQIFHDDFTALMGKAIEVTSATSSRRAAPDGGIESMAFGAVMFDKGVVPYEVVFAEDASGANLKLVNLKMEVPKQYKPELDRAKARTVAKAAADAILAGDYDKLDAMSLPRIRGGRTLDDTAQLKKLLGELGGGVRLEIVKDEACGETQHCIDYHAVGAKAGASITLKVSAPMTVWRVNHWNFTMDDAQMMKKGTGSP